MAFVYLDQKIENLKIKSGESIRFRNTDRVYHNLYSVSPTNSFDLGAMAKGATRQIAFEQPGIVEVHCAVHPEMLLTVEVK